MAHDNAVGTSNRMFFSVLKVSFNNEMNNRNILNYSKYNMYNNK